MNRDELLAAKAVEVTESLQSWAIGFLRPGEQLVVSFRIQNVPIIVLDPEDDIQQKLSYLNMKLLDFFSVERLREFEDGRAVAVRTHNCFMHEMNYCRRPDLTLQEYLDDETARSVRRIPNLGDESLKLIQRTLKSVGLSLKDPTGDLKKLE